MCTLLGSSLWLWFKNVLFFYCLGPVQSARRAAEQKLLVAEETNFVSKKTFSNTFFYFKTLTFVDRYFMCLVTSSVCYLFKAEYLKALSVELSAENRPSVVRQLAGLVLKNAISGTVRLWR